MLEKGIKNTEKVVDALFEESEKEGKNQIKRLLKKLYQKTPSEFYDLRRKEKEFKDPARKNKEKPPIREHEKEKR